MPFKDVLLHLDSYPDPTPLEAMDWTISFAGLLQARLTALAVKVRFPVHSNKLADYLVGISGMAREEEEKSATRCGELLQTFESRATAAGVFEGGLLETAAFYDVGDRVADHARTRDLCVISLSAPADKPASVNCPVRLRAAGHNPATSPADSHCEARYPGHRLGRQPSCRASCGGRNADPHSCKAGSRSNGPTRKGERIFRPWRQLAHHLKLHGIEAKVDEIDAEGAAIGTVLENYVKSLPADLLVMGAYGHSRVREFILGGATHSILSAPPVPVLLSH